MTAQCCAQAAVGTRVPDGVRRVDLGEGVSAWAEGGAASRRPGGPSAGAGVAASLSAWAPVELHVQDAAACLPRLADAVDLAALGETGIAVTVVVGAHRFDLTQRLDRALWRVLVTALPRPGT